MTTANIVVTIVADLGAIEVILVDNPDKPLLLRLTLADEKIVALVNLMNWLGRGGASEFLVSGIG